MALPLVNFAGIPPKQGPDLADAFSKGIALRYQGRLSRAELQQKQLANALQQIKLKYAPEREEAELAYTQAQLPYLQAQTSEIGLKNKYYPQGIQSEIAKRLADIGLTNMQTKFYPQNVEADIANKLADAEFRKASTKFMPIEQATHAVDTLRKGSRFGQAYELSTALKNMGTATREAWISQNPDAYMEMVNTLANQSLEKKEDFGAQLLNNLLKTAFPQESLTLNANDQNKLRESGIAQPGNIPNISTINQSLPTLPVNPNSKKAFSTNPQQSEELKKSLWLSANKELVTAATRRQMEGAIQVENIMNDPELQRKVINASEYAGAVGKGKVFSDALSQSNPSAYEDYLSLVNHDMVLLQNRIKTLDQMGSTDSQREELHGLYEKTMSSSLSNPKQFIEQFNKLGSAIDRIAKAVKKSASPIGEDNRLEGFKPIKINQNNMVKIQAVDGKIWSIPKDNIDKAIARGAKRIE